VGLKVVEDALFPAATPTTFPMQSPGLRLTSILPVTYSSFLDASTKLQNRQLG